MLYSFSQLKEKIRKCDEKIANSTTDKESKRHKKKKEQLDSVLNNMNVQLQQLHKVNGKGIVKTKTETELIPAAQAAIARVSVNN